MRLKEKAEEDLYFARRDRALIAERHARRASGLVQVRSGGQTGVDRGALDAALAVAAQSGLSVGGWCPRGRWAEDGVIPARYPLTETPSADPSQRTEWNVRDADGTLILSRGRVEGGTQQTAAVAQRLQRPLLIIDPAATEASAMILNWLGAHGIRTLNVAGPRESEQPGSGARARRLLDVVLPAAAGCRCGNGG